MYRFTEKKSISARAKQDYDRNTSKRFVWKLIIFKLWRWNNFRKKERRILEHYRWLDGCRIWTQKCKTKVGSEFLCCFLNKKFVCYNGCTQCAITNVQKCPLCAKLFKSCTLPMWHRVQPVNDRVIINNHKIQVV